MLTTEQIDSIEAQINSTLKCAFDMLRSDKLGRYKAVGHIITNVHDLLSGLDDLAQFAETRNRAAAALRSWQEE